MAPYFRPIRDTLQLGVDFVSGRRAPDTTTTLWVAVCILAALGFAFWLRGRKPAD